MQEKDFILKYILINGHKCLFIRCPKKKTNHSSSQALNLYILVVCIQASPCTCDFARILQCSSFRTGATSTRKTKKESASVLDLNAKYLNLKHVTLFFLLLLYYCYWNSGAHCTRSSRRQNQKAVKSKYLMPFSKIMFYIPENFSSGLESNKRMSPIDCVKNCVKTYT